MQKHYSLVQLKAQKQQQAVAFKSDAQFLKYSWNTLKVFIFMQAFYKITMLFNL